MIQRDAQEGKAIADVRAGLRVVFADAGGENQGVHAVHRGGVRADLLADHIGPDLQRGDGVLIARLGGAAHIAHVAGEAGEAQQAALFVEQGVHFLDGDLILLHDIVDDRRVDGAAARAHHHAFQRGEAHGSIHDLAILHRGERRAVAQVADDQLFRLFRGQNLARALRHKAVAGAMETVAAHLQALIIVQRQGVQIRFLGHGHMESGIEHRHHGRVRHHFLAGADAHQVGGVVQRAQRDVLLDGRHHFVVDEIAARELLAAMQHAVADRADLVHGGNHAVLLIRQRFEHQADGGGVVFQRLFHGEGAAGMLMRELAALDADALHVALGDGMLVGHVDELVFQRGGTRVDNQDVVHAALRLLRLRRGDGHGRHDIVHRAAAR